MKKTLLVCLFLGVIMLLNGCAVKSEVQEPSSTEIIVSSVQEVSEPAESVESKEENSVEDQIAVIGKNLSTWSGEVEYSQYGYAVTDLNQNGRLEIVAATCQGSGLYTDCNIYEVNDDCTGLTKLDPHLQEGDSWPDILVDQADVYYDKSTDTYYYIIDDVLRVSMGESAVIKESVSISKTDIKITSLATQYNTADENGDLKSTYSLPDETEITEKEFESIADKTYADFEKKTVNFSWQTYNTNNDILKLSDDKLISVLKNSFDGFSIK